MEAGFTGRMPSAVDSHNLVHCKQVAVQMQMYLHTRWFTLNRWLAPRVGKNQVDKQVQKIRPNPVEAEHDACIIQPTSQSILLQLTCYLSRNM